MSKHGIRILIPEESQLLCDVEYWRDDSCRSYILEFVCSDCYQSVFPEFKEDGEIETVEFFELMNMYRKKLRKKDKEDGDDSKKTKVS